MELTGTRAKRGHWRGCRPARTRRKNGGTRRACVTGLKGFGGHGRRKAGRRRGKMGDRGQIGASESTYESWEAMVDRPQRGIWTLLDLFSMLRVGLYRCGVIKKRIVAKIH